MAKKQITIPIFIPHLGCPFNCIFCNQWAASGTEIIPDKDYIINKIETYTADRSKNINRIEIAFFGGSFTGIDIKKQEEFLSTAYEYLKKNIIHGIRLSTRPDYINSEKLELLKKYRVSTIELGVQSFDNDVLTASKRGHTPHDIFNAIDLIKKYNFDFVIQLMPGLLGDTKEKSIRSALTASEQNPSAVRIYPTVVLKNTQLENLYNNHLYNPLTMEQAIEICKEMYVIFKNKNINIIRMGLHPFSPDELATIVAGPYHPSFGFFVKSRIKRDIMEKSITNFIKKNNIIETIHITIPQNNMEEYIGYKKENISYLKQKFNLTSIACHAESGADIKIGKGGY